MLYIRKIKSFTVKFEGAIRASYDLNSCVEVFDLVSYCALSFDCSVSRKDFPELPVRYGADKSLLDRGCASL